MRSFRRSPCMDFLPLPAAFSGSPSQGHRRVSHADGHAVFKVHRQNGNKKASQNRPACLRFFWKVMLVGYVTAESQDVQPRRSERICKNMLYSIIGINYHKNRACQRELVGARPSILLRKTVLSLKSPTGAFIAALRFANANFCKHVTFGSLRENTVKTLAKRERAGRCQPS